MKVIVLDHAHEYFLPQTSVQSSKEIMTAGKKAEEQKGVASSVDVLEVLLGLCKTQQRISMILSTSSSLFPFDLFDQTGVNILPYLDLSLCMVADMPPYEIRHYLKEEWRVRQNLQEVLIKYYGGDIVLLRNVLLTFITSISRQQELPNTPLIDGYIMNLPTHDMYSMLFGYNAAYEEGLLKCHHNLKQKQDPDSTEFMNILQTLANV